MVIIGVWVIIMGVIIGMKVGKVKQLHSLCGDRVTLQQGSAPRPC